MMLCSKEAMALCPDAKSCPDGGGRAPIMENGWCAGFVAGVAAKQYGVAKKYPATELDKAFNRMRAQLDWLVTVPKQFLPVIERQNKMLLAIGEAILRSSEDPEDDSGDQGQDADYERGEGDPESEGG